MSEQHLSFSRTDLDRKTLEDIRAEDCHSRIGNDMAVLASVKVWQSLIKSCRVVLFTDSEAVRGFLKSWSANNDSDKMVDVIFQVEETSDVPLWIERVPSQSNLADLLLPREVVTSFGEAKRVKSTESGEVLFLLALVAYQGRHSQSLERGRKRGRGKCHSHFHTFKKSALASARFVVSRCTCDSWQLT